VTPPVDRDPRLDPARVPILDPSTPLRRTRGWRLPLRIARRDASQHPWRTGLGMLMVGLPVLVALGASIAIRTDSIDTAEVGPFAMGQAQGLIVDRQSPGWQFWASPAQFRYDGGWLDSNRDADPGEPRTQADLEEIIGSPLVPITRAVASVVMADRKLTVTVTEFDPLAAITDGLAVVDDGSLPTTQGEVAISPLLARQTGLGSGDALTVGDRDYSVSGIATVPVALGKLEGAQVIGFPGSLPRVPGTDSTAYLVTGDLPDPDDPALDSEGFRASGYGWSRDRLAALRYYQDVTVAETHQVALTTREILTDDGTGVAGALGVDGLQYVASAFLAPVYALVLIQLAVMSAPALAVGVRQSRRTFALLQGAGADAGTLRRTVLAQALVIGALGAAIGAGVAVAAVSLIVAAGWWPQRLGIRGPLDIRGGDVALAVGTATVATLLAGLIPAIRVSRNPPVGSLSRSVRPGLPWRRAVAGVTGIVAAMLLVLAAQSLSAAIPLAVLLFVVGLLLTIPIVVVVLGKASHYLPLPGYLASRDAARAGGRSFAAIATVAVAVAAAVSAAMTSASLQAFDEARYEPRWPMGTTVVIFDGRYGESEQSDLRFAASAADVRNAVKTELPTATLVSISRPGYNTTVTLAADTVIPVIADPEVLTLLRYPVGEDDLAAMSQGTALLIAPDMAGVADTDSAEVRVETSANGAAPTLAVDEVNVRRIGGRTGQPGRELLMTPQTARQLNIPALPQELFIQTPRPLTTDDEAAVTAVATARDSSSYVYTERGYQNNSGLTGGIRLLFAAAVLVVILGTATATALSLIDTRRERDLIAAAGASPRTARSVAAATALAYSGIGALLGTLLGVLLGLVFAIASVPAARQPLADPVVVLPWPEITVLVLAVPLVLACLTWLLSRPGSALSGARASSRV